MTDYLQMKIDNLKTYTRMLKKTFRQCMFALVVTVTLGILCYTLDNIYCVGVMVMASIYLLFFMFEHYLDMRHNYRILENYKGADWQKDIHDAKSIYEMQKAQYETLIKRESQNAT